MEQLDEMEEKNSQALAERVKLQAENTELEITVSRLKNKSRSLQVSA